MQTRTRVERRCRSITSAPPPAAAAARIAARRGRSGSGSTHRRRSCSNAAAVCGHAEQERLPPCPQTRGPTAFLREFETKQTASNSMASRVPYLSSRTWHSSPPLLPRGGVPADSDRLGGRRPFGSRLSRHARPPQASRRSRRAAPQPAARVAGAFRAPARPFRPGIAGASGGIPTRNRRRYSDSDPPADPIRRRNSDPDPPAEFRPGTAGGIPTGCRARECRCRQGLHRWRSESLSYSAYRRGPVWPGPGRRELLGEGVGPGRREGRWPGRNRGPVGPLEQQIIP